ncbi:hypothetical protein BS78_03G101300 [Paspalum vaginatum]|nr:hypothetical protein BS78_03G101300 [Paspalum vaginatum]
MCSLELDRDSSEHLSHTHTVFYSTSTSTSSSLSSSRHADSTQARGVIDQLLKMSNKKIVIKADLVGTKCKSEILAAVSKLQGIKSMEIDAEKCTLTVVGTVDPVCIVHKLKKKCFAASIVSVADDKPKEKDTCKEVCEKLCKERCEKITCCKECKEKCEEECKEACEKKCKAWLGCCSCSTCCKKPSSPPAGCYYVPGGYPYYPHSSYPPYYPPCYEDRSPDGACTIQ